MNYLPTKDSLFEIAPWQEDGSPSLPQRFLKTHTPATNSFKQQQAPQFQIGSQTLYVIQNHPETFFPVRSPKIAKETNSCQHMASNPTLNAQLKSKKKDEATQNNRAKSINFQSSTNNNFKFKEKGPGVTSVRSTSRLKKARLSNKQTNSPFAHTQKIVFEVKSPKFNQTTLLSKDREGFTCNLLKIYQRSTLANDLKRKSLLKEEPIDQICQRRKLKTEKDGSDSYHLSTMLRMEEAATGEESISRPRFMPDCSQGSFLGRKKKSRKNSTETGTDKLKFQLLMERKLFMLKSQSQWLPKGPSHKILQSNSHHFFPQK